MKRVVVPLVTILAVSSGFATKVVPVAINSVTISAGDFPTITAIGSGFCPTGLPAAVYFNGTQLQVTSLCSDTTITASLPLALLSNGTAYTLKINNLTGGSASFNIGYNAPVGGVVYTNVQNEFTAPQIIDANLTVRNTAPTAPAGTFAIGIEGYSMASTGIALGVVGSAFGAQGIGVQGLGAWEGVVGQSTDCASGQCSPTAGTAGTFVTGIGGNILVGNYAVGNDWFPVFRVDSNGKAFFDGGTQTGGADFAESISVRGDPDHYEPGDLLSVDRSGTRRLALTDAPYSTLIAGIYSTKPGVLATTHQMSKGVGNEVPLAIVGIVPCKVSTENGSIQAGDLLVSSSTPGFAMKGTDRSKMLGAVVGKALEPLKNGKGTIQILVTLQ